MRISLLALSLSLSAVVSACAVTGDEGPDGAPAEGVAERGEELTWASGMEWTGANKLMVFSHGYDSNRVVDSIASPHEVFQVLVDPRANSTGKITVSKEWGLDESPSCAADSLSVRAFAQLAGSSSWVEIRRVDAIAQEEHVPDNYEFCRAAVDIAITSNMTQVRVMSQARRRLGTGPYFAFVRDASTVDAYATSPAPKLEVTADILPNASLYGVVKNVGPVTADASDTMFVYAYDYCPPAKAGEVGVCEHPHVPMGTCGEHICGRTTIVGARSTIPCQWSKSFNDVEIGANGGTVAWSWGQPGVQQGCGLCNPGDNRCVNVRASVTSRVTTSPYNLMPSVQDKDDFHGVL